MEEGRPHVQFVLDSSVRSDTLLAVVDGVTTTRELIDYVSASESAVYNALQTLERRGTVHQRDDEWAPTGCGQLVAEVIERRDRTERLLRETDYWQTHDVSALPDRFRRRLPELCESRVIESTKRSPHRAIGTVARQVDRADTVRITTPAYLQEYGSTVPATPGDRIVVDRALLEGPKNEDDPQHGTASFEDATVRTHEVDFMLIVCEDRMFLSLPTLEGTYDVRTKIAGETERAIDWGRQLFEHVWSRATPHPGESSQEGASTAPD